MFLTKAEKIWKVEEFRKHPDRIINILRMATPELISRYLTNSWELQYILDDLNKSSLSSIDDGMIDKFEKLQKINDLIIAEHFENHYGIKGVGLSNIHDAFNPWFSNTFDFTEIRSKFLWNGMGKTFVNKMIEDRIFYLCEFGKGPFKINQILSGSVKIKNLKDVDFCTPTLSEYRRLV